ncbi:unnamed protein product [Caenorhabditis sp. 36 PRJEB53466]|nr:unnamed protein product [Caenorhabditis sp. 36 PRJEB53466]
METGRNEVPTGRPYGFASHLRRYGATLAEHKNYGRNEFLTTLAECQQNLGIEGRADSMEKQFDEDGTEIEENDTRVEWQKLACPKCDAKAEHTRALLNHLVESHGKEQDKNWYAEFRTVGKEIKKMMESAIEVQSSSSYVKKKFENSNDLLVCPADSPLTPFLLMRHLQVYLDEVPLTVAEGISLKMQSKMADTSYTVIFTFQKIERIRRRISKIQEKKALERRLRELESQCDRAWIAQNDVAFKKTRTPEETRVLTKALGLPVTCSYEEIAKKVKEMKSKHDELNNVYSNSIKADGQLMTAEEKKLISSLTSNFMVPSEGKRRTTYKPPAELVKKKKKETST